MPNGQLLDVAADYCGRGLAVIPIAHGGKKPSVPWKVYQEQAPTLEDVAGWFDNGTPRNIGIVTGAVSGIVVVDIDSPEAEVWANTHLPPTPMVTTTAKGEHRFYRHPGRPVRNSARIKTGDARIELDVRGDGGYVVAPGSVHESGAVYQRAGDWPAIEELPTFDPAWIESEVKTSLNLPDRVPGSGSRVEAGQRNDTLYRLTRSLLAKRLTPAAIGAAVRAENLARCEPPLDETEVAGLLDHALRQPDQPGFARDGQDEPKVPDTWRILDDVEVLQLPDPEFLIDGILQRRSVAVIYSPPSVGKTTAIASMAVALATGRAWFGYRVARPVPCLYVGAEDPGGFKVRLAAAKRAAGLPLDTAIGVHTFPEAIDLRDDLSVTAFARFVKHRFPDGEIVVFVDTYAAATPGAAENSSEDTSKAMTHGHLLKDALSATVVYAHHTNASGSRERGHSAMRGSADTMLDLQPVDDVIHVEASKQRNGASGHRLLTLKLVPEAGGSVVLRPAGDVLPSGSLSPHQRRAYDVLRETFGLGGATKAEWQRVTTGVPERSFYRAAKVLVEAGFVAQVGTHFRITAKVPA